MPMFIPVEQRPTTSFPQVPPIAVVTPISALTTDIAARHAEPSVEPPEVMEELLIEEVSIDGMCGVY
jgi:mycofactocin precursor